MLANARVLGHVFNPISIFWCHRADGALRAVIAEVHNTYGERHCYLLHPDGAGRARTDKEFFVSPFNEVDGSYRMSLPEPAGKLAVAVVLERAGRKPFTATMTGVRRPATAGSILAAAAAVPLAPLRVWCCRSTGKESNSGPAGCPSPTVPTTKHRRPSHDSHRSVLHRFVLRGPSAPGKHVWRRLPGTAGAGGRRRCGVARRRPSARGGEGAGGRQGRGFAVPCGGPPPAAAGGIPRRHGTRHRRCRRAGDDRGASGGLRGPDRRQRADRAGGVLHGGGLGGVRPRRRPRGFCLVRGHAHPRSAAETPEPVPAAGAPAGAQHRAEYPRQHLPALRPLQRAVRQLPGRDHELLLRAVPGLGGPAGRGGLGRPGGSAARQDRQAAGQGRGGGGHPAAGDRHRLGRTGPAGRGPGRHRVHGDSLQ